MGKSALDTETDRVIWLADGVTGLPAGLAGERYRCRACGHALILKGSKPGAKVTPHFSHPGEKACARPEQEALIDADTEVVIQLRDSIRARPGFDAHVMSLGEDPKTPSGLPPVIVCTNGETTVVIEHPGPALPEPEVLQRRIRAVREHHGGAEHVWFLRKDPNQFGKLGTLKVWLQGKKEEHLTVAPTGQQEAIVAAGGSVYWLDGKLVQVPYGVRWFQHPVKPEQEDWTGWPKWKSDPRRDWRISKPRPAADADCWGLVPISLSSMTRARAAFRPADAYQVMDALYAAQQTRHRWRRQEAETTYAQRNAPPKHAPLEVEEPAAAGGDGGSPTEEPRNGPEAPTPSLPPQSSSAVLPTAPPPAKGAQEPEASAIVPPPPLHPPRVPAQPTPPRGRWRKLVRALRGRGG